MQGLLIDRGGLLPQIGQPSLHSLVGQRVDNRRIELGDDLL